MQHNKNVSVLHSVDSRYLAMELETPPLGVVLVKLRSEREIQQVRVSLKSHGWNSTSQGGLSHPMFGHEVVFEQNKPLAEVSIPLSGPGIFVLTTQDVSAYVSEVVSTRPPPMYH